MTEYDNNLRGVLFKNDRKEKDTHPDYKGSCEIEGVEFWLSAWIKTGQRGKFMSLSFSPKTDSAPAPPPAPARQRDKAEAWKAGAPGRGDPALDDVPF